MRAVIVAAVIDRGQCVPWCSNLSGNDCGIRSYPFIPASAMAFCAVKQDPYLLHLAKLILCLLVGLT